MNIHKINNWIMKKIFIYALITLTSMCTYHLNAQTAVKSITLDGSSSSYIARDWILLEDGNYTTGFEGKIDEYLQLDVDYLGAQPNPNRELNTGLTVGSTPGSYNVTPTGAATYTIPIEVPPGTAGVQPGISIGYNSQGGNGVLGFGWNIQGLSAITRVPKNIYNDGSTGGVNLDSDDKFALGGNRLLCTSGTYGDASSVYRTEIETFSRITAYGTAGTGPSYFIVETQDGSTLEYGNTPSSRIEAYGSSTVLIWRLNKVTDANGNYIEFDYGELNGESYIQQIRYTGNEAASITPYNEINFFYELRDDENVMYTAGSQIPQTLLLNKINVKCESEIVREYLFSYTLDSYSHLSKIEEFGKDGSQFNSTIVNWGTRTPSLQTSTPTFHNDEQILGSGDFNGDGHTDYASYIDLDGLGYIYTANEDGTSFNFYKEITFSEGYFVNSYITDLNGDAKDDLIIEYFDEEDIYDPEDGFYFYEFYVSSSSGHSKINYELTFEEEHAFLVGDFTGDGLSDCIIADFTSDSWYMYSYLYSGGTLSSFALRDQGNDNIAWHYGVYADMKRVPIDYNSNGKQDIILINPSGYDLVEYNGSNLEYIDYGNEIMTDHKYLWGDFNGDGHTDFYYNRGSGGYIKYSDGISYNEVSCPLFNTFLWDYNNFYSMDMNGDGLMDLVAIGTGQYSNGDLKMYVSLSTGTSFKPYNTYTLPTGLEVSNNYNQFGDFNGDGNMEYMYADDELIKVFNLYQGKDNMLVQSITNGMNFKTSFTYRPMTEKDNNFYTKGSTATFPVCDIQIPVYLVSSTTTDNGTGSTNTVNYTYQGAKLHRQGKNFLGLSQFTLSDVASGMKSIQNYGYNSTYFNPYLTSMETRTISSDALVSSATYTNQVIVLDAAKKRVFPYVDSVANLDNLTNTINATRYSYDNDGNPYYITNYQGDDVTTTIDNVFAPYGNWGPDNKIVSSTVSKQYTGEDAYTRKTGYAYDGDGKILQEITDPDSAKAVTKTYSYTTSSCGLPLSVTLSVQGIESRANSFSYDPKYRFPVTKTNALNHITSTKYDYCFGLATSKTDINGNTTTYAYDGFGRLKSTKLPTGKTITTGYGWVADDTPVNAMYYTTSSGTGSPTKTAYYDLMSRELRNVATGFEGELIYADKEYNADGSLYRESNPYMSGDDTLWTRYVYDTYNRMDSIVSPTCAIDYAYSGKTTTITDCNGRSSSKTVNSAGDLVTATDDGGTITYSYHSSGQPDEIVAAGATTTIAYNGYGRQVALNDPDAGTISYSYNALGELIKQINANEHMDSMAYDKLGRLLSKITTEGTITYTYDNTTNGKGLLSTITGYGNTVTYTYDAYSRISSKTNTIDGTDYTESYTYNNTSNTISQLTYPSGFSVQNEYDSYGYLKKVKNGASTIWQCNDVNNNGQVTDATLGNGLTITKGYDQYGFPTSVQTGSVQNMTYSFNTSTGNLTWRKDLLAGRNFTETFTYDGLNRLTNSQIGLNNYGVSYYPNGNINTKHDAGTYVYANTPHAVTQLTSSPLVVSDDQSVDYNSFNKPTVITEGVYKELDISYGVDMERVKSYYTDDYSSDSWTRVYTGNYEVEWQNSTLTKKIHYISGGDGLAAVYIIDGSDNGEMYYVSKDYLGSIMLLTDASGSVAEEYSYDAWGRRRKPSDWTDYNVTAPSILYRGYTGHEHLDEFALINMNGRVYDPVLGRFLSPDNFVQMPGFTQNYNRYSYVLNNPMKYTDPSGEIILGLLRGLIDVIKNGGINWHLSKEHRREAWTHADPFLEGTAPNNSARIWGGLFTTNDKKNFGGRTWELISRFTWQLPQTITGFTTAHYTNVCRDVYGVDYYDGATVLETSWGGGSFTLGSYIELGNDEHIYEEYRNPVTGNIEEALNPTFMHEYGHYIQSQKVGPFYFYKYAIPSVLTDNFSKPERDANYRAYNYFSKHHTDDMPAYRIWETDPTTGIWTSRITDWDEDSDPRELNKLRWWEAFYAPFTLPFMPLWNY